MTSPYAGITRSGSYGRRPQPSSQRIRRALPRGDGHANASAAVCELSGGNTNCPAMLCIANICVLGICVETDSILLRKAMTMTTEIDMTKPPVVESKEAAAAVTDR